MEAQKQAQNKYYGQNLEKEKLEDHEITQNDQSKLIENVTLSLLSSSRPQGGFSTAPSPLTSASRPSKTTAEATRTQSTADSSTAPTSTRTTCTRTAARTSPKTSNPTQSHS